MSTKLTGIAASEGIVIAKAYSIIQPDLSFETSKVTDVASEIARFDRATAEAEAEIEKIYQGALTTLGEENAEIFQAHLQMVRDPELIGQIKQNIQDEQVNAETALKKVADFFIQTFQMMEDNAYMQERAADVKDVTTRILAHLLGIKIPNPQEIKEEVIIVSNDLTPSDTAQLNKAYIRGFVTNIGGRTSHSAIMARSLEIPAVVGTSNITENVKADQLLILDGLTGEVIIEPTEEEVATYEDKIAAYNQQKAEWAQLIDQEAITKDGHEVELVANIGTPNDLPGVMKNGAAGVGLYRTEFLYMDNDHLPSEEQQFESYKTVLEAMGDKPVVIRTMDIGGDKELPYMDLPKEMNPFLGYRAIRICLEDTELFKTQLRALLRASAYGNLKIMFPMIASINEFRQAKALFEEAKAAVMASGHAVSEEIELGMMIEIPATAVLADQFAKEVDFFSIGTNDLIQYTMAADRMNNRVSYLYQPYNPAILRLIKNVIEASHKEGKWTGMCGEMAGEEMALPILVAMGLDEFSMSASSILRSKALLRKLDRSQLSSWLDNLLAQATSAEEVVSAVKDLLASL